MSVSVGGIGGHKRPFLHARFNGFSQSKKYQSRFHIMKCDKDNVFTFYLLSGYHQRHIVHQCYSSQTSFDKSYTVIMFIGILLQRFTSSKP